MTLSKKNLRLDYLWHQKDGIIARYDGKERLWTAERFNLRQIKMETGQQVRMHVKNTRLRRLNKTNNRSSDGGQQVAMPSERRDKAVNSKQ